MSTSLIALALAACLACGTTAPHSNPSTSTATEAAAPAETCVSAGEADCLARTECTLVQESKNGPYTCKAAEPPCETDFDQAKDTADACTAKEGCRYESGYCYCAPGLTCICGGGPPPRCLPISQEAAERSATTNR